MQIALDFDETYTADPMLWASFVTKCKVRGHTVTFVTYRPDNGDNSDIEYEAECLHIDIVYTGGRQKQHVFEADIWIDDSPATIVRCEDLKNMLNGCIINKDLK
jgi:hypothetical protein